MDVNEALQWADQWTEGHTFYEGMQGWRVVCATLAAEVRRLQAVEAVPVAWARADLLPLAPDRYTPCILTPTKCVSTPVPLYKHPHALDDDTRKLVLELLDELDTYSLDPYLSRRSKEIVKILKEKLGAGE